MRRTPRPRPARPLVALLLALALLLPPLALAPPAGAAGECLVTSGLDSGPGTLRAVVASDGCATGGTVEFVPGIAEVRLTSFVRITRALTIRGNGRDATTIRYTGASAASGHVIQITGGPAILRDLTIADGKTASSTHGGGIRIAPSAAAQIAVTLERVRVANNQAEQHGGGVYASNATVTIADSLIEGNTAGRSGGGIYLTDITGPVVATLTNTGVAGNAAADYGGGIANIDSDASNGRSVSLTVQGGSTLSGNTARHSGGLENTGAATLTNATIVGNTISGIGGGLGNLGTATLTNVTISGNTAFEGGGLFNYGAATLTNVTISGNTAGYGGGLRIAGGATALTFATVTGNRATDRAGGLYVSLGGTASLTLARSVVAGNSGGAAADCDPDASGPRFASGGYNLTGAGCPAAGTDSALTGPLAAALDPALADNGGPTRTHNLVAGGPAVDRIPDPCGATTDQRGVTRPQPAGGKCDIGAVEYTATPPSPSPSPSASPSPSPGGPAPSFADVPPGYWAHGQIVRFAQRGITTGCDTDAAGVKYYCPERPVTRAEMAAFLIRTLTGQTAAPAGPVTPTFSDVPANHPQYGYIEALVALGITTGCGGTEYCPDREVTRAEMAAFIIRAKTGQTAPPPGPGTATFGDVPVGHPQYGFIEEMAARRITTGCGDPSATPRTYCPDSNVTRAEMAVFVIRAYP